VKSINIRGHEATLDLLDGQGPVTLHADQKGFQATARLHKQLVAVPCYVIKQLGGCKMPHVLRRYFYGQTPVWIWDEHTGNLRMDGQPTGYTYDHRHGLRRLKDSTTGTKEPYDEYEGVGIFDISRFDW
jgi:hypothetical protein